MNRLILIGNGFDLAHGLKTSYADFLFSYLKQCFEIAARSSFYEDDIMAIQRLEFHGATYAAERFASLDDFLPYLAQNDSYLFHSPGMSRSEDRLFRWKIKTKFIRNLILNCQSCGWVDIELEYYNALKSLIIVTDQKRKNEIIGDLNKAFQALQNQFEHYLESLAKVELMPAYSAILENDDKRASNLILSFNYTSLLDPLIKTNSNYKINHIHGQLKTKTNPMIFGYGDDLDEAYKNIELQSGQEFLRFAKSFGYILTENYRNLNAFLTVSAFEVYVLGLSCGLTDRTMLHMIFEHSNCKNIKVFYYQKEDWNNFSEVSQQISRHFRDKQLFRLRMTPLSGLISMPQKA